MLAPGLFPGHRDIAGDAPAGAEQPLPRYDAVSRLLEKCAQEGPAKQRAGFQLLKERASPYAWMETSHRRDRYQMH
jgi:hypothetical protein